MNKRKMKSKDLKFPKSEALEEFTSGVSAHGTSGTEAPTLGRQLSEVLWFSKGLAPVPRRPRSLSESKPSSPTRINQPTNPSAKQHANGRSHSVRPASMGLSDFMDLGSLSFKNQLGLTT